MATTDTRRRNGSQQQAERHAAQARKKADEKRKKADGASGWVAGRAGDWVSGRRLAKALQLDKLARLKVFPIALSAPWGIGPAVLPEIPLPTKIRTAFQDAIELDDDPERADDDYVDAMYDEVRGSIQRGMDALARRRLPLFG